MSGIDLYGPLRTLVDAMIVMNQDTQPKEVGDRVGVWSGPFNVDATDGHFRKGNDPLFEKQTGIVIETGCGVIPHEAIEYVMEGVRGRSECGRNPRWSCVRPPRGVPRR